MRVALVNNNNNIFFAMARHLRDRGMDVTLLIAAGESPHFHPSWDTFDLDYQAYTRDLSWGDPIAFDAVSASTIERSLEGFDKIVGCGAVPGFLHKIRRPLDVFVPYGSDLKELPFRPPGFHRRHIRSLWQLPLAQRAGVRECPHIIGDPSPLISGPLASLGYRGTWHEVGLPMIYTPLYDPETILDHRDRSHWFYAIEKLRNEVDVLVFSHARHIWKGNVPPEWQKGNDKLFRGLRAAINARPDVRFGLVCLEYGPDVIPSKELVAELGLEDRVVWLPKTARKELMLGLAISDIGCGEFGESWLSCGTIYEVLAMGKPLLQRREDSLYTHAYPELYPVWDVKTSDDVKRHLVSYADDPDAMRTRAKAGRKWLLEYSVKRPLDTIQRLLERA